VVRSSALVLTVALVLLGGLSGFIASPAFGAIRLPQVAPEQLCPASAGVHADEGDAEYQKFLARFAGRFKSDDEARWAWRVYKVVNETNATVVIGRLSDTKSYVGKPGYCVLSDLSNWTVAINDVFIYGGTDRSAKFLLVSNMPFETMNAGDHIDPQQVEKDRETNWRIIYNHEIHVLTGTGKYHLPNEIKPPLHLAATKSPGGNWSGTFSTGGPENGETQVLSYSGTTLTASGHWKSGARYGSTAWHGCVLKENVAKCTWTGTYEGDPDKFGHRHGTLTATLSGDKISGEYYEDEPTFDWHVAPYPSAMHKGAVWPFNFVRTTPKS